MRKGTISLSIIVKNEAHVVTTMLNSVYFLLDYYVVVDTGSSDGTQDVIKKFFDEKGIPGEIIQHEWKNFGDARNVALDATIGKADYGFWIDADDQLFVDHSKFDVNEFKTNIFNYDGYHCKYYRSCEFTRLSFFSTTKPWKWYGALHEVIECGVEAKTKIIEGLNVIQYATGGSWSNPDKFKNYVTMIEDFMKTTDKNHHLYPRWVFYLAQCYGDIGDYDNAVRVYEERCDIKYGFNEEIYVSLLRIANIKRNLGLSEHELIDAYLRCLLENPNRAEHLPPIIEYYQSTNRYQIAYIYSSYAMKFAETSPKDSSLFIDISVYNWKIYDLHNLSCWWSGRIDEAKETFRKLWSQVEKGVVDEDQIPRLIGNKKFNM